MIIADRKEFYKNNLNQFIKDKNSRILVIGSGELDKIIFQELGYKNFTLSNINNNDNILDCIHQNSYNLNISDEEYDYCVAHACIHHSSKPHNSLLEMYRVSKKGILIIEANDSLIIRIACKLGISEDYEISAIKKNVNFGGVDNTGVPNYVFRWTEKEIFKLFNSYKPEIEHNIIFNYSFHFKFFKSVAINLLLTIFFFFFKKQGNLMSIFINKDKKYINYKNWYKI
jgi:SAM-dependent methyltransferase